MSTAHDLKSMRRATCITRAPLPELPFTKPVIRPKELGIEKLLFGLSKLALFSVLYISSRSAALGVQSLESSSPTSETLMKDASSDWRSRIGG